MNKPFTIALFSVPLLFLAWLSVGAEENPFASKFKFPIAALDNCASREECRVYCDKPEQMDACIAWAEKNGFIKPGTGVLAKEIKTKGGPGGCKSEKECRVYCAKEEHFDECIKFAEAKGLIRPEEVKTAKKVRGLTGPGGCRGLACKEYCAVAEHQEECLKFAQENNLISKPEERRPSPSPRTSARPSPLPQKELRSEELKPRHEEEHEEEPEPTHVFAPERSSQALPPPSTSFLEKATATLLNAWRAFIR